MKTFYIKLYANFFIFRSILSSLFPLIACLIFHWSIGNHPTNVKVGIVSDEFVNYDECLNSSSTQLMNDNICKLNKISCRYIDELFKSHEFDFISFYKNFEDAKTDVKKGKLIGFVYFNVNYTFSMEKKLKSISDNEEGSDIDLKSFNDSKIIAVNDNTNLHLAIHFYNEIYNTYETFMNHLKKDCNITKLETPSTLHFLSPIYGTGNMSGHDQVGIKAFLVFLYFGCVLNSIMVFVEDRTSGCWNRTLLTGIESLELLIAHFIIHTLVLLLNVTMIFTLSYWIFPYMHLVNFQPTIVIFILVGICGLLLGIMLGTFIESYMIVALVLNMIIISSYLFLGKISLIFLFL